MTSRNKIDTHTHILPPAIPNWEAKFGYPGFIGLEEIKDAAPENTDRQMMKGEKFFRTVECNCFDHNVRIKECDEQGVQIQVLSTVPVMFNYWAEAKDCLVTSRFINDHIASVCREHPTRFVGLGTVPMQDVELACTELVRCMKELGLKGVEIGTHINGKQLDDDQFLPFWQLVEELGAVVFVHPWDMMAFKRLEKHWLPWLVSMPAESSGAICSMIFGGIYKRFPKLKVYYAHGSGGWIGTLARIQKGFDCRPDLYPDQCNPRDYLKHIMVDSLTHDPDMILKLIKELGPNNIMVGSDYPFPLGELYPPGGTVDKVFDDALIDSATRDQILFGNASRMFGLSQGVVLQHNRKQLRMKLETVSPGTPGLDVKTKIKSDLKTIVKEPKIYSTALSVTILSEILKEMCRQYHEDNALAYVDNGTYDVMVNTLKDRNSSDPFFVHRI